MPRVVEWGDVDVAIGGLDWLLEERAKGLRKAIGSIAVGSMGCRLSLQTLPGQSLDDELVVYTPYPALARDLLDDRNYQVGLIRDISGKAEGFSGKLQRSSNAIVDIVETGSTMRDNGLIERDVLIEDIPMGVMFRKEPVSVDAIDFEPWKFLYANKVLEDRKQQFDAGTEIDTSRKNTLLLLADQNKLIKTIGEEQAELVSAIISGERASEEANDLLWAVLTGVLAQDGSLQAFWAEYCRRNAKPSKSVKK